MAEFDGLESRLRDALGQAAQPGDSAGVADVIRARVAAGDLGSSVAGSTAPGWGGGAWSWLPVVGIVIAAVVAGGAVGASGLVGRPTETVDAAAPVVMLETVDALACVDGPVVDGIPAGTPVLATLRSEDGSWVGVRSPSGDGSVVWIPVGVVTLDDGQPELAGLPVGGGCPVVVTPTPTPTPEPEITEQPAPPQPNPAPSDTTPPSIQQWWAAPTEICADPQSGWATTSTVSALASDNSGVAGVRATWSGGAADLALNSGTWSFAYDPPSGTNANVAITLVARDAAGNTSPPRVVNVQVYSVGNCLI